MDEVGLLRARLWHAPGVGWDDELFALFDELEGRAEALYDVEREPELRDRSHAEYAAVTLAGRLMASDGEGIGLEVTGVGHLDGTLTRVAGTWCLVASRRQEWIVPFDAVSAVTGASSRALPEVAWSPLARLSLGSALRRIAEAGEECLLHRRDGTRIEATPRRIGQDFVEAVMGADTVVLVPFTALAAVQRRGQVASGS